MSENVRMTELLIKKIKIEKIETFWDHFIYKLYLFY